MTHRTDTVFLPANEPRCDPQQTCSAKWGCARYMAALPAKYGSMGDFSVSLTKIPGLCMNGITLDAARQAAKQQAGEERAVKGWPT